MIQMSLQFQSEISDQIVRQGNSEEDFPVEIRKQDILVEVGNQQYLNEVPFVILNPCLA